MTSNQLCHKCGNTKPLNEFNKSSNYKSGYRAICRDCRNTHRAITRGHKKYYESLLEQQDYCCAICGKSEQDNGQRLSLDHNHLTLQVRALLCRNCNTGLGAFKDNEELLVKAIEYIKQWSNDATA